MSVKIITVEQAPNRANRHSYCQELPEWDEALNALATLPPGKVIEVVLAPSSLEKIGCSKNKASYFGQNLRLWFKNARIPATAWARTMYDGHQRVYIKRTGLVASHKAAS